MQYLAFTALLAALAAARAGAQQPAPAPPTVLRPGHMQAQARGSANRPDGAPQFPGGAAALGAFFQEHLKYPEAARVQHLTGNVVLTATVDASGALRNFQVAQPLSPACDAEALRVAAELPAWQPATRHGVPIPVRIQFPVPFGNGAILQVSK